MPANKFTPEFKRKLLNLLKRGYTAKEVCYEMDIAEQTYYRHLKEDSELNESVIKAKEQNIKKVENFLFKKCEGFFIEEQELYGEFETDDRGKVTLKKNATLKGKLIKRYIPPDFQSIRMYLQNVAPDEYKEQKETDEGLIRKINVTVEIVPRRNENIIEGQVIRAIEEKE